MHKILRRIQLNLKRKSSKNILKILIFVILFSMLFSSLYIQNISKQLEDSIIGEYDIYIDINSNIEDWNYKDNEKYITDTIEYNNMITDIANNTLYSYYDLNYRSIAYYSLIHSIKLQDNKLILYDQNGYLFEYNDLINQLKDNSIISTCIKSVRNPLPQDMEMNAISLVEGRLFTEEEIENGNPVCLVPVGFREYSNERGNSVWLDDYVTVSEIIQNEKGDIIHYKEHSFKVIGTYSVNQGSNLHNIIIPEKQLNEIMISSIQKAKEYDPNYLNNNIVNLFDISSAIFKFETIDDFKTFLSYIEKYTDELNNKYTYSTTMETQFSSISNILTISKSIYIISILCLLACVCITFIILLFEIESSKKEIGILLSMGESIREVITQYLLEMILISILSMSISFVFTQTIGGTAIRSFIKNEVAKEESVTIQHSVIDKYEIELEQYTEILQPLSLKESIHITFGYILGICIFEGMILTALIKRIDPKELLKDD